MSNVKIRTVAGKADLKAFIRLSHDLYAGDPNWVPPLDSDLAETLSPEKNPFGHAERELYIAEVDGRPQGRIAAIVDRNYNEAHKVSVGCFGFFECANDQAVADALFDQVRAWLKERSLSEMRGPANPSLNDEVGMLYEGFDSPPVIKTSYNPPYYLELCTHYGMTKVMDMFAYSVNPDTPLPEKMMRVVEHLKRRPGLVVRCLDMSHFADELKRVKEIYNDAWSNNWDFSPMTQAEVDDMARKLKPLVVPEMVPFVEINGEAAGVSIALPDYNQLLRDMGGKLNLLKFLLNRHKITGLRLWALGMKSRYRRLGLDALLYYQTCLGARKKGFKTGEVSLILEDNYDIIRPIAMWGGKLYKKYRIFKIPV